MLLEGKKVLVAGVLDRQSIAFAIASIGSSIPRTAVRWLSPISCESDSMTWKRISSLDSK